MHIQNAAYKPNETRTKNDIAPRKLNAVRWWLQCSDMCYDDVLLNLFIQISLSLIHRCGKCSMGRLH